MDLSDDCVTDLIWRENLPSGADYCRIVARDFEPGTEVEALGQEEHVYASLAVSRPILTAKLEEVKQ